MKSLFILSLTWIAFTCILTSCEKEQPIITSYDFEGEWSWVETTFGWSPPLNPDSLGHSVTLILDHTNYTVLVDDLVSHQWSYEFKSDTNRFGTPIEFILLETGKRYNLTLESDNLVLSDALIDGASSIYVRK